MTRSIKALIVGLAMAGVAATASAARIDESEVNRILVRYSDLNLESGAGAATLLSRLSKAANKVCDLPAPGPLSVTLRHKEFACREEALQNAVASVGHSAVTALYQTRRGGVQMKLASR
jgi:UrcA family protein